MVSQENKALKEKRYSFHITHFLLLCIKELGRRKEQGVEGHRGSERAGLGCRDGAGQRQSQKPRCE